jgi:hypothetical protein
LSGVRQICKVDRCHIEYLLFSGIKIILINQGFFIRFHSIDIGTILIGWFIDKPIFIDLINSSSKESLALDYRLVVLDIGLVNLAGFIVVKDVIYHLV